MADLVFKVSEAKTIAELKNVGPATLGDYAQLGITTLDELRVCDPTKLYHELSAITKVRQDPCVWDVFAANIHEAKTKEAYSWWYFTRIRKSSGLKLGDFI